MKKQLLNILSKVLNKFVSTMKPSNRRNPKQWTCLEQWTKHSVPNMTLYVKLPPNSGHLSITYKFSNTRRCPLFRSFTVYCFFLKNSCFKKTAFYNNPISHSKHLQWSSFWGNLKILLLNLAVTFPENFVLKFCNTVKPLNSGHLRVLKICSLLRGVRYWEVI